MSLPFFKIASQIYDENIAKAIWNMEIVSNNLVLEICNIEITVLTSYTAKN